MSSNAIGWWEKLATNLVLVIFRWWWHGVRIIIDSVTTIREDEQKKNAPSGAGQCFDICGRLQFSPASFLSLWRGNRPEITMAGVRHTNYNGCCWQRSKQKIIFLLTCRNELVSSLCVLYSMTIIIMPSTILRPKFDFLGEAIERWCDYLLSNRPVCCSLSGEFEIWNNILTSSFTVLLVRIYVGEIVVKW